MVLLVGGFQSQQICNFSSKLCLYLGFEDRKKWLNWHALILSLLLLLPDLVLISFTNIFTDKKKIFTNLWQDSGKQPQDIVILKRRKRKLNVTNFEKVALWFLRYSSNKIYQNTQVAAYLVTKSTVKAFKVS